MGAAPVERIEVKRQRRGEGLAFAGLHLGDASLMQHHAADHLHVEMPRPVAPERAAASLADDCERLDQQAVERFAVLQTRPELVRLRSQLVVRECLH